MVAGKKTHHTKLPKKDEAKALLNAKADALKAKMVELQKQVRIDSKSSFDELFPLKHAKDASIEPPSVSTTLASSATEGESQAKKAQMEVAFDAKAFLRTVPHRPGCYRMYGAKDQVIYVGKAKDLFKRLSSYFTGHDHSLKTQALVSNIKHIEFTVTFSESEALLLENELIKKYQPHYNILLRDDKSYPYLHLTSDQDFAGIYLYRGVRRKGGEYFGPFPDSSAVKDSLRLLQKIFPIRQCLDGVFAHRSRPCLMAQMGKCLAPCMPMNAEQAAHYQEQVDLLRLFLQGHNQELLQAIVAKMEQHAERMEFEQAARLRDQLTALRRVQESNSIIANIDYPLDVIGWSFQQGQCCVHVLFIRQGRILGTRSFFPQHTHLTPVQTSVSISAPAKTPVALSADDLIEVERTTFVTKERADAIKHVANESEVGESEIGKGEAITVYLSPHIEVLLSFLSQFYLNQSHAGLLPDEVVIDLHESVSAPMLLNMEKAGAFKQVQSAYTNKAKESSLALRSPVLHVSHYRDGGRHSGEKSGQNQLLLTKDRDSNIAKAAQLIAEIKSKQDMVGNKSVAGAGAVKSLDVVAREGIATQSDQLEVSSTEFESESLTAGAVEAAHAVAVLQVALQTHLGKKIRFVCSVRGSKKRFVQLAMTNAQVALHARLSSVKTAEQRSQALEQLLGFNHGQLQRLECYDISHTMGELTVGSCVVFNREGPDSSRYRRYNIMGITPGDDFAAMHQVLTRRFRDLESAELPDLILIDGGLGQLKQAEQVLALAFAQQLDLMPQIVAVAKGEGRKEGLEILIKGWTHERIKLDLDHAALQLVLHIRDEAHRFAITGHRKRRAQARRNSTLEDIAGVGAKRRQALLQHLGGMQEVTRASIEELAKVPSISRELAQKIYEHIHGA